MAYPIKYTVSLGVKYLDQQTKATQVSQFNLSLEKNGNIWKTTH
nr:conjugal transfer protein [Enterococcus casseliflavus]